MIVAVAVVAINTLFIALGYSAHKDFSVKINSLMKGKSMFRTLLIAGVSAFLIVGCGEEEKAPVKAPVPPAAESAEKTDTAMEKMKEGASMTLEGAKEKAAEVTETVTEKSSEMMKEAGEMTADGVEKAKELSADAVEKVKEMSAEGVEKAKELTAPDVEKEVEMKDLSMPAK